MKLFTFEEWREMNGYNIEELPTMIQKLEYEKYSAQYLLMREEEKKETYDRKIATSYVYIINQCQVALAALYNRVNK